GVGADASSAPSSEARRIARAGNNNAGTAAIGCPVEQGSTGFDSSGKLEEQGSGLRPDGQPKAAAPTCFYDHPSEADRYQMIRTYFQMLIEEELPDAIGKMKQFTSWFTHRVANSAGLRKAVYESRSGPEILARVDEFFAGHLSACNASEA
ncbi:MAG: hypothetical protein KGL10_05210, partial [Alphaproteobacteria bacterium]|nr:hypothetical protein [Alphaproteobacteria bacterium]